MQNASARDMILLRNFKTELLRLFSDVAEKDHGHVLCSEDVCLSYFGFINRCLLPERIGNVHGIQLAELRDVRKRRRGNERLLLRGHLLITFPPGADLEPAAHPAEI